MKYKLSMLLMLSVHHTTFLFEVIKTSNKKVVWWTESIKSIKTVENQCSHLTQSYYCQFVILHLTSNQSHVYTMSLYFSF